MFIILLLKQNIVNKKMSNNSRSYIPTLQKVIFYSKNRQKKKKIVINILRTYKYIYYLLYDNIGLICEKYLSKVISDE